MLVTGRIISGGDETPEGLMDAPRKFVYRIETDDGSVMSLSYTAFPPSPFGDRQMRGVTLTLHEGRISPGHYVKTNGTYNAETNTLTIAEEGDFIETSPEKL